MYRSASLLIILTNHFISFTHYVMEWYYDSCAFVLFVCSEGSDADPGIAILYASDQNIHQSLGLASARNVMAMNYGYRIDPPPLPGTI